MIFNINSTRGHTGSLLVANIITPVPVLRLVIKRWAALLSKNNFLFLENQLDQSILITVLSTLLTPSRNTFECQVWCSISGKTKTKKKYNRECAFGLSGRGRGGSRLPGTHSTQFIGHEVMRLSTYYCAREAYCSIV